MNNEKDQPIEEAHEVPRRIKPVPFETDRPVTGFTTTRREVELLALKCLEELFAIKYRNVLEDSFPIPMRHASFDLDGDRLGWTQEIRWTEARLRETARHLGRERIEELHEILRDRWARTINQILGCFVWGGRSGGRFPRERDCDDLPY